MKDTKVPAHQIDVVEIMKKIRQSAISNRAELTVEDQVRREAKSEFAGLVQDANVPDYLVQEIKQQRVFEAYDPRTLYSSSRSGVGYLIGLIRKILRPITKLFLNLDPMAHELHRLTLLNNFYLRTMQDLIVKMSALRVEIHAMKKRSGHHRPRENNRFPGNQDHRRSHRHHRRQPNEENRPVTAPQTEEPQAQG